MTPAEELRDAAAKLRALATAASTATATQLERGGTPTTTWHFTETERGHGYLYAANPSGPGTRLMHSGGGRGTYPSMRARHGEYAAAMDPGVGHALAAWLDSTARYAELHDRLAAGAGAATPDPHPDAGVRHALAVARAINGEASAGS